MRTNTVYSDIGCFQNRVPVRKMCRYAAIIPLDTYGQDATMGFRRSEPLLM